MSAESTELLKKMIEHNAAMSTTIYTHIGKVDEHMIQSSKQQSTLFRKVDEIQATVSGELPVMRAHIEDNAKAICDQSEQCLTFKGRLLKWAIPAGVVLVIIMVVIFGADKVIGMLP